LFGPLQLYVAPFTVLILIYRLPLSHTGLLLHALRTGILNTCTGLLVSVRMPQPGLLNTSVYTPASPLPGFDSVA
jgi:hypothetical protein